MVLSIKAKGIICGVSNSEKTRCCCCSLRLKGIANNCTNVNKAVHCFQMFSSVFCKILVQTILQDSSLLLTHKTSKERQKKKKKRIQHMDRDKRIWYLSPMRAAKVQASLRIRAVSPEPSLLAHTSSESRVTFRQKARSLAPLNGWACAVKICHDGMLEDTNSLDAAHMLIQM